MATIAFTASSRESTGQPSVFVGRPPYARSNTFRPSGAPNGPTPAFSMRRQLATTFPLPRPFSSHFCARSARVKLAPSILITVADLTALYNEDIIDPLLGIWVRLLEVHLRTILIVRKVAT